MSGLRPIEKQFDPPKAQRIRQLIERAGKLRRIAPEGAVQYYFTELATALEAGALLASLHLAATTLELFIRALVIDRVSTVDVPKKYPASELTYQEQLEEDRNLGIGKLIDHLVSVGLFRADDANLTKIYYQEVRTPLAHGLLERLIHGRPEETTNLFRLFGRGGFTQSSFFEKVIEDEALDHIEFAIGIVERNANG